MTLQTAPSAAGETIHRVLLPAGWPKPRGYANGILAAGRTVFLGGQIGWDETGAFPSGFTAQVRQTLSNIVAILAEAGARPEHIVRLNWFVTDIEAYAGSLKEIGGLYREIIGAHYPCMTLVQVVKLVEPQAMVEIEATAVLPD
jgi:enamine deaminase RidA (YjgF/YER057c/UK114 family)